MKALKAVTDRIAAGDLSARAQLADTVAGRRRAGRRRQCHGRRARHARAPARAGRARAARLRGSLPAAVRPEPASDVGLRPGERSPSSKSTTPRSSTTATRGPSSSPCASPISARRTRRARLMATLATTRAARAYERLAASPEVGRDDRRGDRVPHAGVCGAAGGRWSRRRTSRVRTRAEAALAERAALTTVSAEVGAALNRPGELRGGLQSCAEAIVAHLDLAAVRIWLWTSPAGRGRRHRRRGSRRRRARAFDGRRVAARRGRPRRRTDGGIRRGRLSPRASSPA